MINDKITTLAVSRPKLPETYIDIYIRAFVSMTFKLLAMGHQTTGCNIICMFIEDHTGDVNMSTPTPQFVILY